MKNFREKLLILSFIMFSAFITAQELKITGTVLDADDQMPLIGASVLIEGTTTGAATDFDGNYAIDANTGDVLVFSYLGYEDFKITVGSKTIVNASLAPAADSLDEVVVIGYGSTTKKDLTGSVSSVKADVFQDRPVVTMEDALQGNASGLLIQTSGGQPGAAANINIRGVSSLSGSSQPLIVIDGFPITEVESGGAGGTLNDSSLSIFAFINPNDIASVEVLKDASATAIYGVRGANGVILITSKKGKKGKAKVSYNTYLGVRNIREQVEMLGFNDYATFMQEYNETSILFTDQNERRYGDPELAKYKFDSDFPSVNWQDKIFRTGFVQSHSLSIQGGAEKTNYRMSASYLQDNSIIIATDFKKYNAKMHIDQTLSDKLKVGATLSYNYIFNNGAPTDGGEGTSMGVIMQALTSAPYRLQDADTQAYFRRAGVNQAELGGFAFQGGGGPEFVTRYTEMDKSISRLIANAYIDWTLTDKLKFKTYVGSDMYNGKDQRYSPQNTPAGRVTDGTATAAEFLNRSWLNENLLTYKNQFYNHKINIVTGVTAQESHWEWTRTEATTFENELLGYSQLSGAAIFRNQSDVQDRKIYGLLARANYTFKEKLNLTFSVRRDGTSKFKEHWQNFPSAAISYNLADATIFENNKLFSLFKLRASIGETGNANVPTTAAFSQLRTTNYSSGGEEAAGQSIATLANEKLSWETTQQINTGIDLSLFKDNISITADYYIKKTRDLILNVPVPALSGFPTAWQNVGEVRNSGVELSISSLNVKSRDFEWRSSFNATYVESLVEKLGDDGQDVFIDVNFDNIIKDEVILREGGRIGDLFGYEQEGLYLPKDFDGSGNLLPSVPGRGVGETPGEIKFKDINGDGVINGNDRTVIGNTLPDYFGSLTNNFRYKSLEMNIVLQYSIGNDVFNATRTQTEDFFRGNQSIKFLDRWTPENSTSTQYSSFNTMVAASTFIEDASFVRIKNIRIGYNLPSKVVEDLNINNIKIYAAVDNLAVFTKYSGYDPEISSNVGSNNNSKVLSSGFDYGGFPRARTVTLGINVDF